MDPFQGRVTSNLRRSHHGVFRHLDADEVFFPQFVPLENRRLLAAVVTCLGQDGVDLVGPDASQGPTAFKISTSTIGTERPPGEIAVQAPGGFEWATQPDPNGCRPRRIFSVVNAPVRAISISTRRSRATWAPMVHAPTGRLDGQPDPARQRHDADGHDHLSGPDHS